MRTFKRARALAAVGMMSGLVWAGTFATFSDDSTAESTFTAGTVDIGLDNDTTDAYAFTAIEMSDMKPGDVKYAPLTIKNLGSLNFTYSMSTSATNTDTKGLRDQLTLEIREVAATTDCDATGFDASVTTLTTSGALSSAAIASRSLSASTSEIACFKVVLPSTADNTFQGATTTATFTFSATQA